MMSRALYAVFNWDTGINQNRGTSLFFQHISKNEETTTLEQDFVLHSIPNAATCKMHDRCFMN